MTNGAEQRASISDPFQITEKTIASVAQRNGASEEFGCGWVAFDQREAAVFGRPKEV